MRHIVLSVFIIFVSVSGCTNSLSMALGSGVVISVGKQNVTLDEFKKVLNNFSAENGLKPVHLSKDLVMANIDNLVNTMLLLDEAGKEGITVTTDEIDNEYNQLKQGYTDEQFNKIFIEKLIDRNLWLKQLKEQLIIKKLVAAHFSDVPVSQADVEHYYKAHPGDFSVREMIKARQMEFSSEQAAQQALDALTAGQSFTKVAQTYSNNPQASSGGDMGVLAANDLPRELEGVLFSLPVGKVSGIIKTQFGYQIFLVEYKIPPHNKSLAEAKADIISVLRSEKTSSDFTNWINTLKEREGVHINYELLKRAGLI
jgi:parvulin-like peptidyl-prolyl isomerase